MAIGRSASAATRLAVVLLSGGLDSTVAAAVARRDGYEVLALTVDYGQSHAREIEAARRVAVRLGLAHRVLDLSAYRELARHSALTWPERVALPEHRGAESPIAGGVPASYVPLRNTFLLTLAAAALESRALEAIEAGGAAPGRLRAAVFIAANAIDYSGYPDCRPEYYRAAAQTLRLGSKLGTHYGVPLVVETPLIDKTKADIVRLGVDLEAPLAETWSCYRGGEQPCGRCDSCRLRAKGFAEAGMADPALAGGAGD